VSRMNSGSCQGITFASLGHDSLRARLFLSIIIFIKGN
jgi:hypothetical protein